MAPDAVIIDLLKQKFSKSTNRFCLDGFPRRRSQAEALENILKPVLLEAVLLLDLPESILLERITGIVIVFEILLVISTLFSLWSIFE